MKILLLGPIIDNGQHGAEVGIFNALTELGHEAYAFDYRVGKLLVENSHTKTLPIDKLDESYDIILAPGPGLPDKILTSKFWKNVCGTKILWNSEPIRLPNYYVKIVKQFEEWDVIFTFDDTEVPIYEKLGCKNVQWLPQAFNPQWYKPLEVNPENDFCFIGSIGGKWSNRPFFLRKVQEFCQKKGLKVKINSAMFDGKQVNEAYNNSKVILNLGLYHSHLGHPADLRSHALQQRIFEACGSGRVCLTNEIDGDTIFVPGREIVFYNKDNLFNKMEFSLNNWQNLAKNVVNIRERHSYKARLEEMFNKMKGIKEGAPERCG